MLDDMTSKKNLSLSSSNFNKVIWPWLVCGLAVLFYSYEFFLRVAPSVMTEEIMRFYNIGAGDFAILTAYYSYAYVPMQICVGLLMDHYGPRRLLCLAIICCIIGCFILSSFGNLSLGKFSFFAIGFGSSFAFVGVLKLSVNWLPPNNLSFVSGVTTALGLLGGVFAQRVLAGLAGVLDWREIWYYSGLVGFIILVITFFSVYDHPKDKLPDVENIPEPNWKSLFYDLIDMVKSYKFIINGLIGSVLYLPVSLFGGLWAVSFFHRGTGLPQLTAATLVTAVFIGMAIGGPIASLLSEHVGRRKIFYQVSLFISFFLFLVIILCTTMPVYVLGCVLFLLGLTSGSQILVFAVGIELSMKEAAGTATATTNFLVMISLMILSPMIGNLLEYSWDGTIVDGVAQYSLQGYQTALLILPACYFIAFVLSFLLHDTHPKAAARKLAAEQELLAANRT